MTDVALRHEPDGGEIESVAGQVVVNDGLETAVYLSLFGGNEQDSGIEGDDPKQWWGNLSEPEAARRYRSETQHLLRSLPATSSNLRRVEDAAGRDLAWMVGTIAKSAEATATIPALNTVQIDIAIVIDDRRFEFRFTESWGARQQ